MIRRLYIDNYKSLVNLEFRPERLQLLMGANGAGKTSVFEVLTRLRQLVVDQSPVGDAFDAATRTRWDRREELRVEIDLERHGTLFTYTVLIDPGWVSREHNARGRLRLERLRRGEQNLFLFEEGEVQLYRDDGSTGPAFGMDWTRSALATVPERHDNQDLTWFRRRLDRIWCVQINPWAMAGTSAREATHPSAAMENFVSWYRHASQERPKVAAELFDALKDVLDGFDQISIHRESEEVRSMKVGFTAGTSVESYDLLELSEGQRAILALYSLIFFAAAADTTLCIDEPDNFVALREIQPWLLRLEDCSEHTGCQALIVSHHPELINYLAPSAGIEFERQNGGPTRLRSFAAASTEPLKPAEVVARGWQDG